MGAADELTPIWKSVAYPGPRRLTTDSGHAAEARLRLEELVSRVPESVQPYDVATALAVLSLIAGDQGDRAAASLARRALAVVDAHGLSFEPLSGIVHLALGRALAHHGELAEAEVQLDRALELFEIDSMGVHRAFALLVLASVRHGRGELAGARALVERTRELVERFADPGVLPALLGADRGSAWFAAPPAGPGGRAADRAGVGGRAAAPHPTVDPGDRPRPCPRARLDNPVDPTDR